MISLIEYNSINLVLDLSLCEVGERVRYVTELMHALKAIRERSGIPHWLLLDEAHSLCPPGNAETNLLCQELMQVGGVALISYRPSQIEPALLALLEQCILTCTRLPEELNVLVRNLPRGCKTLTQLPDLSTFAQGQACLVNVGSRHNPAANELTIFRAGCRMVPHIRHLHNYLQAPLPVSKRFYFCDATGRFTGSEAASLAEFRQTIHDVPGCSLEYHLYRGDFERWLREVLHDEELASQLHKLAQRRLRDEALRNELCHLVTERYIMLIRLVWSLLSAVQQILGALTPVKEQYSLKIQVCVRSPTLSSIDWIERLSKQTVPR